MAQKREYWLIKTGEVRTNPRFLRLSSDSFKLYFILYDMAAEMDLQGELCTPDGIVLGLKDFKFSSGFSQKKLEKSIEELKKFSLITEKVSGLFSISKYEKHQKPLESSTERVRRFRMRKNEETIENTGTNQNQETTDFVTDTVTNETFHRVSCNVSETVSLRARALEINQVKDKLNTKEKINKKESADETPGEQASGSQLVLISDPDQIRDHRGNPVKGRKRSIEVYPQIMEIYEYRNRLAVRENPKAHGMYPTDATGRLFDHAEKLADALESLRMHGLDGSYGITLGSARKSTVTPVAAIFCMVKACLEAYKRQRKPEYFRPVTLWGRKESVREHMTWVNWERVELSDPTNESEPDAASLEF